MSSTAATTPTSSTTPSSSQIPTSSGGGGGGVGPSTPTINQTPTQPNAPNSSFSFGCASMASTTTTPPTTTAQQQQQQPSSSAASSSQSTSNPASTTPLGPTNPTPQPILQHMGEEKVYKKEKQIWIEFEGKTKDLKSQLNDGVKCLEQRLDTQISILLELQDFFKKRAEVELQYSRDLDKMAKQIYARHKSERTKRESWQLHSANKLWESLLNDTKQHSKYHQTASEICSKYVADRFDDIIDDIKRMFTKCKAVAQSAHEEIFKVVGELNGSMKTYHEYQSESKQAEAKLRYVQSQKPKYEKQKSKKKLKQYEKQVEKRLQKYTETKVKAFKARNEYILSIDSANACVNKFCSEDIGDIIDCMDYGFHASIAKCIYMYLSAQENIKRSRQQTVDNMSRSIGDLDSNADKKNYLEFFSIVFNIQRKFQFEPHKGDEVSQVNAQSLIRYEMEKRFEQLDMRLKTLKTENDEIFKTIEATEHSLLNYFDVKNCDMTDLFRDLNIPVSGGAASKPKRVEIEDYYVEKVRQYIISSNLIARLEARHRMMQKALGGCVNSDTLDKTASFDKSSPTTMSLAQGSLAAGTQSSASLLLGGSEKKKKIGKSPLIGQPRLFGGKLVEYLAATKQDLPQIMTSCVKAINRLGLHNQGIFRIPGSQLEINQFKEAFEKGEDPLVTVNPREMNSVAGVLKLYLRELKEPLFPRDLYDTFIGSLRVSSSASISAASGVNANAANSNNSGESVNGSSGESTVLSPVENIEAIKIENIRRTMTSVPKPIYIVLRYLFGFLNHLSEFKDENMMDAYNIAICLAPTLIPVPEDKKDQVNHQTDTIELIKLIIQHNEEIFNMECDGPVYEKFDSEMDNDEENLEESDDDEEDESEKQYLRNLSDDDMYVAEAVALYDYKGRSDKELSFKKGTQLAIRGQLSADWWQGSLIASSNNSNNINSNTTNATPLKVGYIPDKYIAFRSSSKKRQLNNSMSLAGANPASSPHQSSSDTLTKSSAFQIHAGSINGVGGKIATSNHHHNHYNNNHNYHNHHHHHHPAYYQHQSSLPGPSAAAASSAVVVAAQQRASLEMIDLNRSTLSTELSNVKESDILNDEESAMSVNGSSSTAGQQYYSNDEILSSHNHNHNHNHDVIDQVNKLGQASTRSASVSLYAKSGESGSSKLTVKNASLIKKRNSSSPSSSNSVSFDTHFHTPQTTNSSSHRHLNNRNYLTLSSSSPSPNMNGQTSGTTTTTTTTGAPTSAPRPSTIRTTYLKSHQTANNAPIVLGSRCYETRTSTTTTTAGLSPTRSMMPSLMTNSLTTDNGIGNNNNNNNSNNTNSMISNEFNYLLATMSSVVAPSTTTITNSSMKTNKLMKMNQIEDALASVLDDMKQLDFSSSSSSNLTNASSSGRVVDHQQQQQPPVPPPPPLPLQSAVSSSLTSTPGSKTSSQKQQQFIQNTPTIHSYSAFKFGNDSSPESLKFERGDKSNDVIEIKRPDLVIDLPIVLSNPASNAAASSSSSSSTATTTTATTSNSATVLPIKKPLASTGTSVASPGRNSLITNRQLQLTSSPPASILSSPPPPPPPPPQPVSSVISSPPNSASTTTYTTTVTVNTNPPPKPTIELNKVRRLSADGGLSSSDSSSLSSSPANKPHDVVHHIHHHHHHHDELSNMELNEQQKPLKSCSTSSTESASSVCSSSISIGSRNKKEMTVVPAPRTSIIAAAASVNKASLAEDDECKKNINDSSLTTTTTTTTSGTAMGFKKKPPPLMKKPEKSEEILRKLGRSPPSIDTTSPALVNNNSPLDSNSSPVSSSSSSSTASSSGVAKPQNLSLRLSNSKATDV